MIKNEMPQSDEMPVEDTCDRLQTLIEQPDQPVAPSSDTENTTNTRSSQPPDSLIGKKIGSGTIVEFIGSGGMGDVYKLRIETLDCYHALKLLKPTDNQLLEQRFDQERKITAKLDHPNIVRAYNGGRWNQYQFLEMEYVEGTPLDEVIQQKGCFTPLVSMAMIMIIARALNYAHNHTYTLDGNKFTGVIHRDLKPSNIILSKNGMLKLMDFGIARPIGHRDEKLTLEGRLVGTLLYLSPEQINSDPVDQRTDIYALGEVLYEFLTGRIAFNAKSEFIIQKNKIEGRYLPLETKGTGIPGKLLPIIDKCLKPAPKSRYQSANEFLEDLTKVFVRMTSLSPEEVLERFVNDRSSRSVESRSAYQRVRHVVMLIIRYILLSSKYIQKDIIRRFVPLVFRKGLLIFRNAGYVVAKVKIVAMDFVIAAFVLLFLLVVVEKRSTNKNALQDSSLVSSFKLISPEEGALVYSDTLWLSWHKIQNGIKPIIHVAATDDFRDTLHLVTSTTDTFLALLIQKPGTSFVRTGFYGINNDVIWDDTRSFKAVLSAPDLIAPVNGAKDSVLDITIQWRGVPLADSYCIHISSKEEFSDSLYYACDFSDTVLRLDLTGSGIYYWRVKSCCKGVDGGVWSLTYSFTIGLKDYVEIVRENIRKNRFAETESIIVSIPDGQQKDSMLFVLAQKLYENKGSLIKVDSLLDISSPPFHNLLPVIVKSRLLLDKNMWFKALILLQSTLPDTQYNRWHLSAEASYYYAKAAVSCYNSKKNDMNRKTAVDALRDVCKWYKTKPEHPHHREAKKMLREITSHW